MVTLMPYHAAVWITPNGSVECGILQVSVCARNEQIKNQNNGHCFLQSEKNCPWWVHVTVLVWWRTSVSKSRRAYTRKFLVRGYNSSKRNVGSTIMTVYHRTPQSTFENFQSAIGLLCPTIRQMLDSRSWQCTIIHHNPHLKISNLQLDYCIQLSSFLKGKQCSDETTWRQ